MKIFFLFFFFIFSIPQYSQNFENEISAVEICTVIQNINNFSSSTEAEYALDKILSVTGLSPNFVVRPCDNINNALAATVQGKRYILFDKKFMSDLNNGNYYWSNMFILAHEVGHHLNNHTIDWFLLKSKSISSKTLEESRRNELEADEFAGFILAKLGASYFETTNVISNLPPIKIETTHPFASKRLASVKKGYDRGKLESIKDYNPDAEIDDISKIFEDWKLTIEDPRAKFSVNKSGNPFSKLDQGNRLDEKITKRWVKGKKIDGNVLMNNKPIIEHLRGSSSGTFFKNFGIIDLILNEIKRPNSPTQQIVFGNSKGKKAITIINDMLNSYVYGNKKIKLFNYPKDGRIGYGGERAPALSGNSLPSLNELQKNYCPLEMSCNYNHYYRPWGKLALNLGLDDPYNGDHINDPKKIINFNIGAYENTKYICTFGFDIEFEFLFGNQKVLSHSFISMKEFFRMVKLNDDTMQTDRGSYFNYKTSFQSTEYTSQSIITIINQIFDKNPALLNENFFIRISKLNVIFFGQGGTTNVNPHSNFLGRKDYSYRPNPSLYPSYKDLHTIEIDLNQNTSYYEFSLKGYLESKK